MNIKNALSVLIEFFRSEEIPFVVVGALGLHGYGLARATFDVDVMVDAAAQDRVVDFLEARGYETLHRSQGFSNHLHSEPEQGRIDVLYIRGETSVAIFADAQVKEIFPGLAAPVPKPEHLIAMKAHAMKNDPDRQLQEMSDIRHLLQIPDIDLDEVREAFRKRGLEDRYDEIRRSLDEF